MIGKDTASRNFCVGVSCDSPAMLATATIASMTDSVLLHSDYTASDQTDVAKNTTTARHKSLPSLRIIRNHSLKVALTTLATFSSSDLELRPMILTFKYYLDSASLNQEANI